jgi:hypothetical protein
VPVLLTIASRDQTQSLLLIAFLLSCQSSSLSSPHHLTKRQNHLTTTGKIVVYVVDKNGNDQGKYYNSPPALFKNVNNTLFLRITGKQTLPNGVPSGDIDLPDTRTPMIVIVDANTASAAEVFAAALKVLLILDALALIHLFHSFFCSFFLFFFQLFVFLLRIRIVCIIILSVINHCLVLSLSPSIYRNRTTDEQR